MEDNKIIDLYFARSEQAIEETSHKYGAYLGVIADNILHRPEDTEEVVNDVYLAAWNSIPPNRPRVLKHYLSRIARNLSFKRFEYLSADKRCADTVLFLSELDECIPDERRGVEETIEARDLGRRLNNFLTALDEEDRQLFVSRYYYLVRVEELARREGCSPRRIKYRLEKLRDRLKKYLQKEGEGT